MAQVSEAEFIEGYCVFLDGYQFEQKKAAAEKAAAEKAAAEKEDRFILGNYTSSKGGELVCISKPDGCQYYTILQGGAKISSMMLPGEFKANGLLHFKPYAITGKLKAGQITWSNGTVYTREDND